MPPYFKLAFVPEMSYIAFSHLAMAAYDSSDDSDSVEAEDQTSDESDSVEADNQTSDESSSDEDATFVVVPDDEDVEVVGVLVPCPPPPPQHSSSDDDEDEDVVCLYGKRFVPAPALPSSSALVLYQGPGSGPDDDDEDDYDDDDEDDYDDDDEDDPDDEPVSKRRRLCLPIPEDESTMENVVASDPDDFSSPNTPAGTPRHVEEVD